MCYHMDITESLIYLNIHFLYDTYIMEDHKQKYLEYKKKYIQLKKQLGGVYIYNFHPSHSPYIPSDHILPTPGDLPRLAEAVTCGKLSSTMTSHCLGTGVYGFIDRVRVPREYCIDRYEINIHGMSRPLMLEKRWYEDERDGQFLTYIAPEFDVNNDDNDIMGIKTVELRSDLTTFTGISRSLNHVCNELYQTRPNTDYSIEYIRHILVRHLSMSGIRVVSSDTYKLTSDVTVHTDDLVRAVKCFLSDYINMMCLHTQAINRTLNASMRMGVSPNREEIAKKADIEQSNYVVMPINYLLYLKNYDGVYNVVGNIASSGSVKYYFKNQSISPIARSYDKTNTHMYSNMIFTAPQH